MAPRELSGCQAVLDANGGCRYPLGQRDSVLLAAEPLAHFGCSTWGGRCGVSIRCAGRTRFVTVASRR